MDPAERLKELALIFLRLGLTAFGGPAAHIGMMEVEFVSKRQWLTRQEFLDLVGAPALLPGPSSSEVAIYIGQKRAGWRGLLLAGICFIFPAVAIITAIAWAYQKYHTLPAVAGVLYGMKPVIVAVIAQAIWSLRRAALKSRFLIFAGLMAVAASIFGIPLFLILVTTGLASVFWQRKDSASRLFGFAAAVFAGAPAASGVSDTLAPLSLERIFFFFLKIGSIQFGSGYVLLAFLHTEI